MTDSSDAPVDAAAAALARARAAVGKAGRRRRRPSSPGFSGSGPDRRDPAALGGLFDRWVRDNQYSEQLAVSGLVARWSEVVGEQVAEHISVEDFRPAAGGSSGGTVVLRADSAAWTLQLKYLQDQILERITQEVGSGLVAAIEIRGPARQTPGGRLRVRHGRRSPRR